MARALFRAKLLFAALALTGCFSISPSSGGGQTRFEGQRRVNPADVELPTGYALEPVATGLTFPSAVAFDEAGGVYVLEAGYSYGEVRTVPRLLRVNADGSTGELARGDNPPWNGMSYAGGAFYVAEGGQFAGGRILRITPEGRVTALVSNLPSLGDHHTNRPVVQGGFVYFGQGTATNSGFVGQDSYDFGWLRRFPRFHDTPCRDIRLSGQNHTTPNPLTSDPSDAATTGAYLPFGTPSTPGQMVRGQLPCSGAVLRVPLAGGPLELYAWGFRNPFSLAFGPDGLYVADNSYDVRGSRPVYGTGDLLWRAEPGGWHGWPDYHGLRPLTDEDFFRAPGEPAPGQVLAQKPGTPPRPVALLGVHSSSNGLDFAPEDFGFGGQAFIAQFGDMAPGVGKVMEPVGFKVVRVDVRTGTVHDFAVNRGPAYGPASRLGSGGLERPVDVRFDPSGRSLYVVDFGVMTVSDRPEPRERTGVLWRITRRGL